MFYDSEKLLYMIALHSAKPQEREVRPRGLMDKASDFESEDWGFESLRGWMWLNLHIGQQCSSLS